LEHKVNYKKLISGFMTTGQCVALLVKNS